MCRVSAVGGGGRRPQLPVVQGSTVSHFVFFVRVFFYLGGLRGWHFAFISTSSVRGCPMQCLLAGAGHGRIRDGSCAVLTFVSLVFPESREPASLEPLCLHPAPAPPFPSLTLQDVKTSSLNLRPLGGATKPPVKLSRLGPSSQDELSSLAKKVQRSSQNRNRKSQLCNLASSSSSSE